MAKRGTSSIFSECPLLRLRLFPGRLEMSIEGRYKPWQTRGCARLYALTPPALCFQAAQGKQRFPPYSLVKFFLHRCRTLTFSQSSPRADSPLGDAATRNRPVGLAALSTYKHLARLASSTRNATFCSQHERNASCIVKALVKTRKCTEIRDPR